MAYLGIIIDSKPTFAAVMCISMVTYMIVLILCRLMFSPLAGFPGPKLAAVTSWYEFYYDFWKQGKYIFEIEEMHQKYGPIVRVNPSELSINDPEFYNEIYVSESKRRTNNYDIFCKGIDFHGSHLLTTDHDLHWRRRKPLEPFFSRMGVACLQPMLAEVAEKLANRLKRLKGTHSIVRLDHAFSAFSGDIMGRICWGKREEFLDDPNFAPEWYNLIHMIVRSIPLFTGFPSIVQIIQFVPEAALLWMFPQGRTFNKFKMIALEHISEAKAAKHDRNSKQVQVNDHTSLFRHIVNSDMPESEMSDERLAKEAQVLLGGGTASTARTLGFISYYILANPDIYSRLTEELREPMAQFPEQVPSWADLERLPYLQALIKEGLRLSYGVMHRLPRCSPDAPVQYRQWTIPPKTPVGMSAYFMHSIPAIYPRPFEFIPERWLGDINPLMRRYFVPFCRGSRNCLGMNLAQAEMSIALAVLYGPSGPKFELFETDESDVKQAHDFVIPLPKLDTRGVRVLVC